MKISRYLVPSVLLLFSIFSTVPAIAETRFKTLHILVTNDDGINSEGISALAEALGSFARVTVVAPSENCSGAGHSITIQGPIMVEEVKKSGKFFGFGVGGTPATCVKVGVEQLIEEKPDLVVSGINDGFNIGRICYISGTFGAAQEGLFKGIPSICVSIQKKKGKKMDFLGAAEFVKTYIIAQSKVGFPADKVINITLPAGDKSEWKGIALTALSDFSFKEIWFRRKTPWGKTYFWQTVRPPLGFKAQPGTDAEAIESKMISITPVPLAPSTLDSRSLGKLKLEFNGLALEGR